MLSTIQDTIDTVQQTQDNVGQFNAVRRKMRNNDDLNEKEEGLWCSWCFENVTMNVLEKSYLSRNVYSCLKCNHEASHCTTCRKGMSRVSDEGSDMLCAKCDQTIKEWGEVPHLATDAWCSWCFDSTSHTLVQYNYLHRNVYECDGCHRRTLKCRVCGGKDKDKLELEANKRAKKEAARSGSAAGKAKEKKGQEHAMVRGDSISGGTQDHRCYKCCGLISSWEDKDANIQKLSKMAWCSWCIEETRHLLEENIALARDIYQCQGCEGFTVSCMTCKYGMAQAGQGWVDTMCECCNAPKKVLNTLYNVFVWRPQNGRTDKEKAREQQRLAAREAEKERIRLEKERVKKEKQDQKQEKRQMRLAAKKSKKEAVADAKAALEEEEEADAGEPEVKTELELREEAIDEAEFAANFGSLSVAEAVDHAAAVPIIDSQGNVVEPIDAQGPIVQPVDAQGNIIPAEKTRASDPAKVSLPWILLHKRKNEMYDCAVTPESIRADLARSSPQKDKARDAGLIRPFLVLVSMHPGARAQVATRLGFSLITKPYYGDNHVESWQILKVLNQIMNPGAGGVQDRIMQKVRGNGATSTYYQMLRKVIKLAYRKSDNPSLNFQKSYHHSVSPQDKAMLSLEEEFMAKVARAQRRNMTPEQCAEQDRQICSSDTTRVTRFVLDNANLSSLDAQRYAISIIKQALGAPDQWQMTLLGLNLVQGLAISSITVTALAGLSAIMPPLALVSAVGTVIKGGYKLAKRPPPSLPDMYAPMVLTITQRLLLLAQGIQVDEYY